VWDTGTYLPGPSANPLPHTTLLGGHSTFVAIPLTFPSMPFAAGVVSRSVVVLNAFLLPALTFFRPDHKNLDSLFERQPHLRLHKNLDSFLERRVKGPGIGAPDTECRVA
jgi:hypothetical protein